MQYVAYAVCASTGTALYPGTASRDAALGHTPPIAEARLRVNPEQTTGVEDLTPRQLFHIYAVYNIESHGNEIHIAIQRIHSPGGLAAGAECLRSDAQEQHQGKNGENMGLRRDFRYVAPPGKQRLPGIPFRQPHVPAAMKKQEDLPAIRPGRPGPAGRPQSPRITCAQNTQPSGK